jgi:hypothetical protein
MTANRLRIATYNTEWFTGLFDRNGEILADDGPSARYGVTRAEQLEALAIAFTAMDADLIMIIEAPDTNSRRATVPMLETFAARFGLRTRRALMGFANETQQEIAILFDPDVLSARHAPCGAPVPEDDRTPRFDARYKIDLDIDAKPDLVTFSKPPFEVAVTLNAGAGKGAELRLIGVHIKSKAPHGATSAETATRIAIENRRKQLAQSIWLRGRVDEMLAPDAQTASTPLIVLGDFNDGPGLDEYEKLFGRSSVEIVLGEDRPTPQQLFDPHAARILARPTLAAPVSARFYNAEEKRYFSAMLDYIMVSRNLCAAAKNWRIWHPFDDAKCYQTTELREALLMASDHFPVSIDIDVSKLPVKGDDRSHCDAHI